MKKIQIISFRIIVLFIIAIFVSFIPDYLHKFFGDWECVGSIPWKYQPGDENNYSHVIYKGCNYSSGAHSKTIHWGYRHWLFFVMGVILFIIQSIDIFIYSNKD